MTKLMDLVAVLIADLNALGLVADTERRHVKQMVDDLLGDPSRDAIMIVVAYSFFVCGRINGRKGGFKDDADRAADVVDEAAFAVMRELATPIDAP